MEVPRERTSFHGDESAWRNYNLGGRLPGRRFDPFFTQKGCSIFDRMLALPVSQRSTCLRSRAFLVAFTFERLAAIRHAIGSNHMQDGRAHCRRIPDDCVPQTGLQGDPSIPLARPTGIEPVTAGLEV